MYTEKEHKQLFKRFFGNDSSVRPYFLSENTYIMKNKYGFFKYVGITGDIGTIIVYNSSKPYTDILNSIFGKDICVFVYDGIFDKRKQIQFHVPSSFEEMTIICDLNGK